MSRLWRELRREQALFLIVASRAVVLVGAPITLLMVAILLPDAQRGVYFILINTQAATAVCEFGFGATLLHFVSREYAGLQWGGSGRLLGDSAAVARIAQLLGTSTHAYRLLGWAFVGSFGVAGLALFAGRLGPAGGRASVLWLVLVLATGLYIALVPRLMVLEGVGRLAQVQRMRLVQVLVDLVCLWTLIPLLGGPAAAAGMGVAHLLIPTVWLRRSHWRLWDQLRAAETGKDALWRAEVLPVQWRTALTWLLGYVGYQVLTPLVLAYDGPVSAGRFGLSLALATAPYSLALAWIQARLPDFGRHVGRSDFAGLERLAGAATRQAALVWLAGSIGVLVLAVGLDHANSGLALKLLPPVAVASLCLAGLGNLLVQSMAGFLRAHQAELFLGPAALGTALSVVVCWVLAREVGAAAVALGYGVATLFFGFPMFAHAYRSARSRGSLAPIAGL